MLFIVGAIAVTQMVFDSSIVMPRSEHLPFQASIRITASSKDGEKTETGKIYRDSLGRVRRDVDLSLDKVPLARLWLSASLILDPVARVVISMNSFSKKATKSPMTGDGGSKEPLKLPAGGIDLGEKLLGGVQCRGKKFEEEGGAHSESWLATELGIIVRLERVSPEGRSLLELFDIIRNEPDPELFRIPSNYTVTEND